MPPELRVAIIPSVAPLEDLLALLALVDLLALRALGGLQAVVAAAVRYAKLRKNLSNRGGKKRCMELRVLSEVCKLNKVSCLMDPLVGAARKEERRKKGCHMILVQLLATCQLYWRSSVDSLIHRLYKAAVQYEIRMATTVMQQML